MAPAGYERVTYERHGWNRSKKGNLWKRLESGETVTIFERLRYDGTLDGYGYCIYRDDEGPEYSRVTFGCERNAIRASYGRITGGE